MFIGDRTDVAYLQTQYSPLVILFANLQIGNIGSNSDKLENYTVISSTPTHTRFQFTLLFGLYSRVTVLHSIF
jgi:hypothetical protein